MVFDFHSDLLSRLLYGERDHPDAVISHLSRRLEETPLPEQLLPQVVETVAEALRLPYVGIDLLHPSGREPAAHYGELAGTPLSLPLTYQGETIGWMLFGERGRGEAFGKKDRQLLEDLARHVGAAAYAVRLTAELQRSREELVRTREEERRRLRRDLHDGLGPTLAAGILQLQVALGLIRTDPDAAERIVSRLASEAKGVVEDIRRLVEALRPPALDQLGLVCAIQERASHFGRPRRDEAHSGTLQVKVDADGDLQGLPAAVEVAAYRIVCEALNNASRHGRASSCSVRLCLRDQALEVEVLDDGPQRFPVIAVEGSDPGLGCVRVGHARRRKRHGVQTQVGSVLGLGHGVIDVAHRERRSHHEAVRRYSLDLRCLPLVFGRRRSSKNWSEIMSRSAMAMTRASTALACGFAAALPSAVGISGSGLIVPLSRAASV